AFDQGQNKWSIGVSVDLPILDQNQGPIAEAEAARSAADARFVATQARAAAEGELAPAPRDGTRDEPARLAAARDDRRANLRRVRSALGLGAADRSSELEARIEALRAARAAAEAERALRQALADLALAIEAPVGGLERVLPALPATGAVQASS